MSELSKITIEDKGTGNTVIKLDGIDITKGITEYSITREAGKDTIKVLLTIEAIPEEISIKKGLN